MTSDFEVGMCRNEQIAHGRLPLVIVLSALQVLIMVGTARAGIQCYACHGTMVSGDYRPQDSTFRNISTGGFPGNHRTHLSNAATGDSCTVCHGNNAYLPSHRNGSIDMAGNINSSPATGAYSRGTSFAQSSTPAWGTCANVNCHFEKTTPPWGSSAFTSPTDCNRCHEAPPATLDAGSHARHDTYYPGPANCGTCHADHLAEVKPFAHATSAGKRDLAVSLHDPHNVAAGTYSGSVNEYLPSQNNIYGTCSNTYCHSNGTSVATGSIPANTTVTWGTAGPLACNACHGTPPAYANGSPKANRHAAHAAYSCNKCHANTTADGTTISNPANHVNKSYDVAQGSGVSFSYVFNTAGGSCSAISCHGSTGAQWGSTSCLGCHSVAQGNRAAVAAQLGGGSHHIQGTLTDAACYQCHWEANSDGSINPLYHGGTAAPGSAVDLVIYGAGTRPTTYTPGTTAIQYHYTSSVNRAGVRNITSHCLGCHSDQNNATQPFGDGKTPKAYAWDGSSVASRYAQSGTTTWGKYTSASWPNTAKKKITKAFSAHGNAAANSRGWDTTSGVDGTITNSSGAVNIECFDCHNSHGSGVSGITSRYSSATGRNKGGILKDTLAGRGGYSVTYQPYTTGSVAGKNRLNPGGSLCLDCHLTAAAGTTPWGYGATFGASQAITGYWDVPAYKGYTTAGAERRYPYKRLHAVSGGHFGASSPLTGTPMSTINGLCTPCHDPHGVSPTLGAKQQYAVPLLKGTWLTSPYKEDVAPATNASGTIRTDFGKEGIKFQIDQNTFTADLRGGAVSNLAFSNISTAAGLCVGCHTRSSLTNGTNHTWKSKDRIHEAVKGWKTAGGAVKHNYTCSKCHSPHSNATLPRLMVTNCLDGKHKGRVANNPAAAITGDGSGDERGCYGMATSSPTCTTTYSYLFASGSGRIPGYYYGGDNSNYQISCHETDTGSGTDQGWNNVTPWSN